MKLRLSFKTPDVVEYALQDQFGEDKDFIDTPEDEKKAEERQAAQEACDKFIQYGEYITVEIDTDTKMASVVPLR